MRIHTLDSQSDITHVGHDGAHLYLRFRSGETYRYENAPESHLDNTMTAKTRNEVIGSEKPGSEGSYLIHNVIGNRANPPFKATKLSDDDSKALWEDKAGREDKAGWEDK